MEAKAIINVVGTRCPPEKEKRFDTWYSETHIPHLLKFKGLKGATRFKIKSAAGAERYEISAAEYPQFLTIYEFGSWQDFEAYEVSPEIAEADEDWVQVQKETRAEVTFRAQYEVIKSWHK